MSGESTGGYKSGTDMWADHKAHYGLIPAHIMCTRYIYMMSRSADPEERRFCMKLSEAMDMEPNHREQPYYRQSFEYAQFNNEVELFNDSDELNVRCAGEIMEAVNACRYQDGSYKLEPAVRTILDRHNAERVGYILATEVRRNHRAFSEGNREWARDFNIKSGFVNLWSGTNVNVLDDFVTRFRETIDRTRDAELSAPDSEVDAVSFYTDGVDYWRDLTLTSRSLDDALFAGGKSLETAMRRECSADDRRFCRELFGAMYGAAAARTDPAKLVYPYDAQTAGRRSETEYFQTSAKRNSECARAIDTAIHLSRYGHNQYNHALAAMKIAHDFGFARVNLVLAHNVRQGMDVDAFSADSRRWADELQTYGEGFADAILDTHPSLTDKFIRQTRLLYGELNADRFVLPGQPECAEDVHGYDVVRGIIFDDGSGFVIGMNPDAPADFACWRFKEENGTREYSEGNYFDRLGDATADYIAT